MYQNPLDHSNHRMLYSFTPGPYFTQQQQPIYTQMIDSTYYQPSQPPSPSPSPKANQSRQINFYHAQQPSSDSNIEIRNKKEMKNLEEDYEKLFVGGEISDVSSNPKIKPLDTKSISIEKYSEEINILKEQYQRKIDYIEEQNEQNQRTIKKQYQLYLDKLRSQNTELIGINKQYQNQIKELLKKMEGISMSDLTNYKTQNSRLKLIIEQLQESRVFNRNNNASNNNSPRVIVETKVVENKQQISYLNQELQRSKKIIENKVNEITSMSQDLNNLQNQISTLKKENNGLRNVTKENDFLFQIERYKEIISKKNNEMGSMTNIKSSLEKQILLLEQSIDQLSGFKEKYYMVAKQKDRLEQSQSQLKRLLSDKAKQIEIFNVQKSHLVKKQEYLGSKISAQEQRYRTLESELRDVKYQLDIQKKKKKDKLQSKEYQQYIQDMSQTMKQFKTKINETQRNQQNEKQNYGKQQQIMDSKFNELTLLLEGKQRQLGELSSDLNQANNDIARYQAKIKEYQETIKSLRVQIDSKNESFENRRSQYEKNLIKFKNEAEIGYNKNLEQFKERISRLEMELAQRSPKKYKTSKHVRSPGKPKGVGGSHRDSSLSGSNNGDLRTQQFEQRINEFLKYNNNQQVYKILQEAKLELRYLISENNQLISFVKVLETSKDLNNKSIIAEDKIRFGEVRLDYINQKNLELQQRITILIAVNTQLKGRVEQANVKVLELQKKVVQYQEKLEKTQESSRESIEKSKQEYDKLFQLHTSTSNKIPLLQRTIGDLTREIEDKNNLIRQMNNKTQTQNTNIQSKSNYFYNRINSLNKDLQYAHQDIEQLKGKIWTLERDLSEANSEIDVVKEENMAKQTEHKILLAKHSEVSIDLNLKSEQLASHKLEIVTLKNTTQYLNQRLKTFAAEEQRKNQATTKEILNLHTQLEQSSITLQSFKQHRQSSEQAVKEGKAQISRLNNQISQLKLNLEKKERELTEVKSAPIPRVESRGSNQGLNTKNSTLLQEKLTKANTEISSLTNKSLAYELSMTKMKQAQSQLEGKLMIVTQQLESQSSQKYQLQQQLNRINEELMSVSRSSKQIQRKQSGSTKQIFELERRLKIVNEEKQSLMKELKQYVTQNHNQTSQKQDKLNIFLKQNLDATQLQLQRASQTIFSLQASNQHYYTLIQQIPARYCYYINYMKKINSQFRYLVGELDLTSNSKNSQVSTKLLNNISESLQIFEQIRQLEEQIDSRIQDLEDRKNI